MIFITLALHQGLVDLLMMAALVVCEAGGAWSDALVTFRWLQRVSGH